MSNSDSRFDGTMLQWLGWTVLSMLLTIITLGIGYPWARCMMLRWRVNHSVVGGKRLKFTGTGGSLFGHWILWWFLSIITVFIFSLWIPTKLAQWETERTK